MSRMAAGTMKKENPLISTIYSDIGRCHKLVNLITIFFVANYAIVKVFERKKLFVGKLSLRESREHIQQLLYSYLPKNPYTFS